MSWKEFENKLTEYRVAQVDFADYVKYARGFFNFIEGHYYPQAEAEYLIFLASSGRSYHQQSLASRSIQIWKESFIQSQAQAKVHARAKAKSQIQPQENDGLRLDSIASHLHKMEVELESRRLRKNTIINYLKWIKRFLNFINISDCFSPPNTQELQNQIKPFLSDLSIHYQVSISTQKQALSALSFYFKNVLEVDVKFDKFIKSSKSQHLPEVLTTQEVKLILDRCDGIWKLFFSLMYGCGLRLKEVLNLRYKDIRLDVNRVIILNSKGGKNRSVHLPKKLYHTLDKHKKAIENLYRLDCQTNQQEVDLPIALKRKSERLAFCLEWQYVFVNPRLMKHPVTHKMVRFHYHTDTVRKNLKRISQNLYIRKNIHPHIFRHSFATHSLEAGASIAELKEVLGHSDIKTTMIYLHVSTQKSPTKSPLDLL